MYPEEAKQTRPQLHVGNEYAEAEMPMRDERRYELLNNAINSECHVIEELRNLLSEITGEPRPDQVESAAEPRPTLTSVLNTGADRLRYQQEEMYKLIYAIREQLL